MVEINTQNNKFNLPQWLTDQKDRAKFAWVVVVVLAGSLGYNVQLEKKIDNEKSVDRVVNALDEEVQKRLDLIEENFKKLEEESNKPPKIVVQ